MKKILFAVSILLFGLLLGGCAASEEGAKETTATAPQFGNRSLESDTVNVVCTNCRAKFKISAKVQKLAMKGKAHIICPQCHHEIY